MKDWYIERQLKSSNVCVGLYETRISDFVFHRRRCRFPNSLIRYWGRGGGGGGAVLGPDQLLAEFWPTI